MFNDVSAYLAEASGDPLAMPKAVAAVTFSGVAAAVYLWGRLRKLPPRVEASSTARVALAPEDRDLGFSIIRAGKDVVEALNDHAEVLRVGGWQPVAPPVPPSPPPTTAPRRPRKRT